MICLKYIMSQFTNAIIPAGIAVLFAFSIVACDEQTSRPSASAGTGTMLVLLHDNPGNYQEVWIDVQRVEVNNKADESTGWVVISEPQERYNLLELINGAQEVLGEAELDEGTYRQIRLILGNNNTIVVDDSTYQLKTPSAQQSGLKLNIDAEIQEGLITTLALDFDVKRSIVKRGRGQSKVEPYLLKPVIRAYALIETGTISGVVAPAEAEPWIYAIVGEDTVSSTRSEKITGEFQLLGLPENTYDVSIEPTLEGYESQVIPDVEVTAGEDTDLGTIDL